MERDDTSTTRTRARYIASADALAALIAADAGLWLLTGGDATPWLVRADTEADARALVNRHIDIELDADAPLPEGWTLGRVGVLPEVPR